ncbi:hypothetical protein VSDG_07147 [Cytospora chrysosperma]|uniref:Spo12-like protein n=1 Tax=Cytospora chrysosperma TaxID=252740 RepID=A0A423VKB4_CYTCH|nr:hypothetical protein VSDG_07147 [Valsa sordida]
MSSTLGNTTAANVLGAKDTNVPMANTAATTTGKDASVKGDVKTMEYHRQVLQSKMESQKYDEAAAAAAPPPNHKAVSKLTQQDSSGNNYVSPSDEIMSPCTAKLNAFRNKQVGKVKPRSLFAQASTKRLRGSEGGLFGSKAGTPSSNMSAI